MQIGRCLHANRKQKPNKLTKQKLGDKTMLLAKRNQDLMPSLFNELLGWSNWNNNFFNEEHFSSPKMNVTETDECFELEVCVPGLKKEDLSICIDTDNNLVIEMQESSSKDTAQEKRYLRHEFSRMQFKQMLSLPENIKKECISAKVEDGILYINLPKFSPEEKKALAQTIAIA